MVRLFRHYVPRFILIIGAVEGAILFAAFYLGVAVQWPQHSAPGKLAIPLEKAGLYTLIMMSLLAAMGLYERGLRAQLPGVLLRVGLGFMMGMLFMLSLVTVQPQALIADSALFTALIISGIGVLITRTAFYHFAEKDSFKRRIMVLGAGELATQFERLRRRSDWQGNLLVGYLPAAGEAHRVNANKILVRQGTLLETANRYGIDEIVVALKEPEKSSLMGELLDCKMSGIQVLEIATFFEQITGKIKLEALNPYAMVFADGFVQALRRGLVHRAFDAVMSLIFLMLTLPVMAITALAILLESGGRGPIFYKQVRMGRHGCPFQILKFRSMQVDAEKDGPRWAGRNDSRVTHVGGFIRRTRIDELPQLLNVLKGEMSFVGPRPERPEFVAMLSEHIPYYALRHCVNPGLTGWAQIRYPYGSSEDDAKEKLQYDLYYVKNYSLFLDLTILLQTAQVVLWGKGAK